MKFILLVTLIATLYSNCTPKLKKVYVRKQAQVYKELKDGSIICKFTYKKVPRLIPDPNYTKCMMKKYGFSK